MWNNENYNRAVELNQSGMSHAKVAEQLNKEFGTSFTNNAVQKKLKRGHQDCEVVEVNQPQDSITLLEKETVSRTTVAMTKEQAKDKDYVLKSHGFEPGEWKLKQATNNFWQQNNTEQGIVDLYQSKIVVEPLVKEFDLDQWIERINSGIKPLPKIKNTNKGDSYLAVPLFDLHFGNAEFETYQDTLAKTIKRISVGHKKVLIIVGGDLLHNDNYRGMTSSGTNVDKVDMNKAWDNSFDYLSLIIEASLKNANEVSVMYVPGNHDEITGQTVIKSLERVYSKSNLTIDSNQEMFKATMLGNNFIGMTHGDKSTFKKFNSIFSITFAEMWGTKGVKTREVFSGHLHHEIVRDMDGLMLRQSPTDAPIDQYHKDNGYSMAHHRFQLVEYNEEEVEAIYYV